MGTGNLRTVHLGQFSRERANRVAADLEDAGIFWYAKEPGILSQVWEFGVRLFVDRARLEEARQIVQRVEAEIRAGGADAEAEADGPEDG